VGVDLSPALVEIARSNAAIMQARQSGRAPIRVVVGDAANHPIPSGDVVLFLYNPFGAPLHTQFLKGVERAVQAEQRAIYIVYYNPVHGGMYDGAPFLTRRWAAMVPYARAEIGYGPDTEDAVVIYQGGNAPAPVDRADLRIVVTNPDTRAELIR
jgi:hypothetical protein